MRSNMDNTESCGFGPRRGTPRRTTPSRLLAALLLLPLLHARHPCDRPCVPGQHLTCRYDFDVESYHTMSKACYGCPFNATDCARPDCIAADGARRALVVVNRQLPGPSLQVCLGDRLEVTVHNHMAEQTTSVHWHGLQQRGTPYMDGVPFVTQCPIQSQSAFRYSFRADNPGTHFWHSHSGCQRADGAVGALTIRVPKALDPHATLYDEDLPEHSILLWDWTHSPAASKFLAHHHAGDDNKADAVLINGKGTTLRFVTTNGTTITAPRATFSVRQGLRYRFRLVNAGFLNCPLELSIDNHTMLVVASDGADVKPVRVDSLVSYAGERWDVVVEATQPVANYWLRVHGLLDCGPRRAHEAAVLRYQDADPDQEPGGPPPSYDLFAGTRGLQVNPLNKGSSDPDTISAAELQALNAPGSGAGPGADPALKPEADVQLFVSYDFYALDNPHIHRSGYYGITQVNTISHRVFTPQLNYISLSLPAFPLLSGRDRLDSDKFSPRLCNETSLLEEGRDCTKEYCECTHVVRVPLGGVLEIVLVDKGVRYDANHPFHLHGHAFRVVALERLGNSTTVGEVQQLDAEGRIARNLHDPPIKDTVTVPDGGYTILRVHADNPGYWLFHCHIEFHVELGMALVVKVGEHEDMPPVPRGFPQCGDWSSTSWLGDGDDAGYLDVADKPVVGNNIARELGALPMADKLRATPSSAPPTSSTATTQSATERATAETELVTDSSTITLVQITEEPEMETTTEGEFQVVGAGRNPARLPLQPNESPSDSTILPLPKWEKDAEDDVLSTTPTTVNITETNVTSVTAVAASTPFTAQADPVMMQSGTRQDQVVVSEYIMRVASSSSSGRRRTSGSEVLSVTHKEWGMSGSL